jgi:acetyl-CoA C-acetyltransferase
VHGKAGPEMGIVFGRLAENNARFVSVTPSDAALFADFEARDQLGRTGRVAQVDGRNTFVPE